MHITDSIALVTGANRGLGLAFVHGLLAAGAKKVYAAARDPATLPTLPGVVPLALDVTRPEQIAAAAEAAGDVTLLVNNAGIARYGALLAADGLEALRQQFETNALAPLAMARAFAPVLARHGGGAIVNVLSALSWLSLPGTGGYSATKSAGWAITNGLRHELKDQGTQVLALHMAYMDTDMARHAQGPKVAPAEVVRLTLQALAEGRREVLADAITRELKQGLSAESAAYLGG